MRKNDTERVSADFSWSSQRNDVFLLQLKKTYHTGLETHRVFKNLQVLTGVGLGGGPWILFFDPPYGGKYSDIVVYSDIS